MKLARAVAVFSTAFAIVYVMCMYFNLALVTYLPGLREWHALTVTGLPPSAGPGMYWYGWIATAALGALGVAVLSLAVPSRGSDRLVPAFAWVVPACAMGVIVFLLRGWFIH